MQNRGVVHREPALPRTHLRALGAAVGITAGLGLFALTVLHVMTGKEALLLALLGQYFYGYEVSWPGAFIGLAWGTATGFVAGCLLGIVHNFTLSTWAIIMQARYDSGHASDLLDEI